MRHIGTLEGKAFGRRSAAGAAGHGLEHGGGLLKRPNWGAPGPDELSELMLQASHEGFVYGVHVGGNLSKLS